MHTPMHTQKHPLVHIILNRGPYLSSPRELANYAGGGMGSLNLFPPPVSAKAVMATSPKAAKAISIHPSHWRVGLTRPLPRHPIRQKPPKRSQSHRT